MSDSLGSGTAKGLISYLDSLVSKGRIRIGVAVPLKTALVKVLEKTEGDDWENVDVTKLDVGDSISRFKNFTLGNYTDASYRAYELRIKRAIKWYENFLETPGWYPRESTPVTKTQGPNGKLDKQKPETSNSETQMDTFKHSDVAQQAHDAISLAAEPPKINVIAYPFPLSNGETARIYMPKGLTKSDVRRLSIFLESLVIDSKEE